MFQRTSVVNNINVKTGIFSSILEIGDSHLIQGFSRALAVQREAEIYFGDEGKFEQYSTFLEPIPQLSINENIIMNKQNLNPFIKIINMDILAISTSSIVHIGNTCHVSLENRTKHFRQLLPSEEQS